MGDLSPNFSQWEFECKCGCGLYIHNQRLIDNLQKLRYCLDAPIKVNSGTRCAARNRLRRGRDNSAHLTGEAADIECLSSRQRLEVLAAATALFGRIGIAKGFIHLDVSLTLPGGVVWLY
jgi:uncharacterized protein YcbK (DUF882 family)